MSMFLLEGSSHRSCNLASECKHVCWLVWVGVCAFLCVGWYVPPEVRVDCCALCVRVRVHVCQRQRVLFNRRFRFDPVFGRPSRARAPTTRPRLWCANAGFHPTLTCQSAVPGGLPQKRAPLPPEPSRVRPCHGFAALDAKSDDPSTQNHGRPKARAATARAL